MLTCGPLALYGRYKLAASQLVRAAAEHGLSGVEELIGVPGHVGGSLAMNAGSPSWGLWDQVTEVTLWQPGGEVVAKTPDEVQPSYRNGNLRGAIALDYQSVQRVSVQPVRVLERFENVYKTELPADRQKARVKFVEEADAQLKMKLLVQTPQFAAAYKARDKYQGDYSRLTDLARMTFECKSAQRRLPRAQARSALSPR